MKPAVKASITRGVNTFNKKWKEVVRQKRLNWVTSYSHEFVEFAEQLEVLRIQPQEYIDLFNDRTYFIELPNGLLTIKADFRRMDVTLEQNNIKTPLQTMLSAEDQAIKELYFSLNEAGMQKLTEKIAMHYENEKWDQFVQMYSDRLKGKFFRKKLNAYVQIDDYNIDVTDMYRIFKNKLQKKAP